MARNSKWNILGWLCLMVLGFVSAPIMVRQLGADLYGLMALLTSFIAPLGLMDLGIGEATIKYVAESLGRKDMKEAEHYLRSTLFFNLLVGVIGAVGMIVFASFLVKSVFNVSEPNVPLAQECLLWLGGIWCATQVRQTFVGAITALQEYKVISIGTFLMQAAHTITGITLLLAGGGLLGMIRAQAVMSAFSVVGWWWLAGRRFPGMKLSPHYNPVVLRKTLRFGLWQMLNNLCGILTHQSQRWLLGAFLPVAAVGFYNVGNQLVTMVYSATYRVGQVLFPSVSQLQGENREREACKLMLQANWGLTGIVISGYVVLAVFAADILRLWVGEEFATHGSDALRILCVGYSTACVFAIPNFYLMGTGRPQWLTYMALGQGCVTLLVAVPFISHWGVAGAAAAISCGTLVQAVCVGMMWRQLFRQWVIGGEYFAASFGPWLTGLLIGVLLYLARAQLTWRPGWFALFGACLVSIGFTWAIIQMINLLLPGGRARWQSMSDLTQDMAAGTWRRFRPS